MSVLAWVIVFAVSLAVLIYGAGIFLRSAEAIGLHLGLSPFIIGVTLVAFGTSLPELVSGVVSVLQENSEIAIGTVVGSNITNILLILGLAAALGRGLQVDYELVRVDLPFLFGSALILWFLAHDGSIGFLEGVIALASLSIYIRYAAATPDEPHTTVALTATKIAPRAPVEKAPLAVRSWATLVVGALLTQLGAKFSVESVVKLSQLLVVGSEVIAATALALGTSLPELVVSARSARQGKPELAVGNVIGSNIFNALGVVGVSALFGALSVPAGFAAFAVPAMVGVTILCFFVLQEREITSWDAWLLLTLYVVFLVQALSLG